MFPHSLAVRHVFESERDPDARWIRPTAIERLEPPVWPAGCDSAGSQRVEAANALYRLSKIQGTHGCGSCHARHSQLLMVSFITYMHVYLVERVRKIQLFLQVHRCFHRCPNFVTEITRMMTGALTMLKVSSTLLRKQSIQSCSAKHMQMF